jgi:hypothetical protein
MGMFDWYEPRPPLACPKSGAGLRGWQGKSGPCALLEWVQGDHTPSRQLVDDEAAVSPGEREKFQLPEAFELYTKCDSCGVWVEAHGSSERVFGIERTSSIHSSRPVFHRTGDRCCRTIGTIFSQNSGARSGQGTCWSGIDCCPSRVGPTETTSWFEVLIVSGHCGSFTSDGQPAPILRGLSAKASKA